MLSRAIAETKGGRKRQDVARSTTGTEKRAGGGTAVTLNESGRFTTHTRSALPAILDTRTSLLTAGGELLIQSIGRSAADQGDEIDQHLLAGTYFILQTNAAKTIAQSSQTGKAPPVRGSKLEHAD